jgi:L-lactate utilization protein LutB
MIRRRHAANATIVLTPCDGPEQRILVAVAYAGTDRIVPELCYSMPDYPAAAALGNRLTAYFNTTTIQQALDALPDLRTALNLAA